MQEFIEVQTPKCLHCRTSSTLWVDLAKFVRWTNGELLQDVFHDANPAMREQLQTGIHPDCWDEMSLEI